MTLAFALLPAQGKGPGSGRGPASGACLNLSSIPAQTLSEAESSWIILMREEEKLARDVYRGMFEKWGANVFARIANSEQRHMDAVAVLIDRYSVVDPVKDDSPGVFLNSDLAALYEELMSLGRESLTEAMKVGATIEDLDIHDLNEALKEVDNADIKFVFGNLRAGSENHMRAFVGQLEALGGSYAPQHISPAEYEAILAASTGRAMGWGAGRGSCKYRQAGPRLRGN